MPRPRYDNVDPEKKKKLLDAACAEFAQHGYELASINRILENAGLSKGSFYYYFDDKADLAATLFADGAEATLAPIHDIRMPGTPDEFWEELRRVSLVRLKALTENRVRYEALLRLGTWLFKDPQLSARMAPQLAAGRALMAGFFERGQAVGALRTDLPMATLIALIESAKTTAYQALYPNDRVPNDAELETFTDLVLDLAKRIASR